jgi:hypothetical protein
MNQVQHKPSTLQFLGSSSSQRSRYRLTNIAIVDDNDSKEVVNDSTINALSGMTSLISLTMVPRCTECSNWK